MPMRAERAPSHASFLAQRRFASLNGLRCLAILEALGLLAMAVAGFALSAPFGIVDIVLAALVAVCCIREDHLAAPLLKARPMRFVGEISYGMYLLHMLAVNAVRHIVGRRFGTPVFVPATGLTIAMAYASYRWFETPILRYRDRLKRGERVALGAIAARSRA
jgi:peptidoglycan/LPS O-acetylase OafA/YrhL